MIDVAEKEMMFAEKITLLDTLLGSITEAIKQ